MVQAEEVRRRLTLTRYVKETRFLKCGRERVNYQTCGRERVKYQLISPEM